MPRDRPASVLVLAIFFFIIGAIGVVQNSCGLVNLVVGSDWAAGFQPPAQQQQTKALEQQMYTEAPYYFGFQVIMGVTVPWLLTIALIAGGFGLLALKPWAWKLSITYALVSILHKIGNGVYGILFIVPIMKQWFQTFGNQTPMPNPAAQKQMEIAMSIAETTAMISAVVSPFAMMIFPIVVLVLLTRQRVVKAFFHREMEDALPAAVQTASSTNIPR